MILKYLLKYSHNIEAYTLTLLGKIWKNTLFNLTILYFKKIIIYQSEN